MLDVSASFDCVEDYISNTLEERKNVGWGGSIFFVQYLQFMKTFLRKIFSQKMVTTLRKEVVGPCHEIFQLKADWWWSNTFVGSASSKAILNKNIMGYFFKKRVADQRFQIFCLKADLPWTKYYSYEY